jgi:fluoroquinolone transport system permease protein
MKALGIFIRWDSVLLFRNRLFHVALAVAAIYTGIFFLLKPLGSLTKVLVILIFNDPVVTGFIFGGVIWLFDKNQHTLQAISVLPVNRRLYLLSKILILSLLAVFVSLVMALATVGMNFNVLHLVISVFLSSFIFSSTGFTLAAISRGFNGFLMYSIPFFIISAVPLLYMFGIGDIMYYIPFPTTGCIEVLRASFIPLNAWYVLIMYCQMIVWSVIAWRMAVKVTQKRQV